MFKKVLCCLFAAVGSLAAWAEDIQSVISYYNPDMSNGFIFVSKQDMTLTLVDSLGQTVVAYPMACGRALGPKQGKGDYRTPEGYFFLQNKHDAQLWGHDFHDGKGFIQHAYGPWFLRLQTGFQGIGIHGTHAPESIGTRATEGCIRLQNDNVAQLEQLVTIGMPVIIGPEQGVDALIAAHVPSPQPVGARPRVVTAPVREVKADPVVLRTVPKFVSGQLDIIPEQDLAEPIKTQTPEPVAEPAEQVVTEAPVVGEAETSTTEAIATDSPEALANETVEATEPTPSAGPRYEVVVEEVTGEDGETKFEVRYVLLP